jgi:hypothetical protein
MLGDKAYDSAELREDLHERGTNPISSAAATLISIESDR